MWEAPAIQRLSGDRLHLQHGPIDLVLRAWGAPAAVAAAYEAAAAAFPAILPGLAGELTELRKAMAERPRVEGPVARRMVAACRPFAGRFLTPMAAVAGAVADHVLEAMTEGAALDRAYVNNGGDIAVHLTEGESLTIGLVADLGEARRGVAPAAAGTTTIRFGDGVGGVATSGAQGRSFSLGIADAVTILARDAASADAAASLVANAVDLPGHPAIERRPARDLDPDSDLGDRRVTTCVGALLAAEVAAALAAGLGEAERLKRNGLLRAAALSLRGETVTLDISDRTDVKERLGRDP